MGPGFGHAEVDDAVAVEQPGEQSCGHGVVVHGVMVEPVDELERESGAAGTYSRLRQRPEAPGG